MDYADDLEQCKKIIIELESYESLETRLSKIGQFYPEEERKVRSLLSSGANLLTTEIRQEYVPSPSEVFEIEIKV